MTSNNNSLNTAKAKVLEKYPKAYSKEGLMSGDWYIYIPQGIGSAKSIGKGETPKKAWENAYVNFRMYYG